MKYLLALDCSARYMYLDTFEEFPGSKTKQIYLLIARMALTWVGNLGLTQYIYENTPEPSILQKLHVDTFVLTTPFDTSKAQKVHLNLDFKS